MTPNTLLILIDELGWRIGITDGQTNTIESIHLPDEPVPADIAQAIVEQLSQAGDDNSTHDSHGNYPLPDTVILGLPPHWCLCGTVAVPDLQPRQKRTAMAFSLEAKLPISVDGTVVDFILVDDAALGVAVQTEQLHSLIEALEDHGLRVDYICPTTLLALQNLTESTTLPASPLAWRDRTGMNLLELDPELRVRHWRWQPGQADTTPTEEAAKEDLSEDERAWVERCRPSDNETVHVVQEDLAESALLAAQLIQAGQIEPLINLRRDALDVSDRLRRVRWQLNAVMASVAVFLLALTGVFLWRAHEYKQADVQYAASISALFQETFGDQPQPTSVRRRLNTRLRELQGLAGQQFDEVESTEKVSALWLLHDLLERIPVDLRVCLLNIKIEHDYLSIDGQARSHSDADRIAAALRSGGRFEVEPPSTRNLKEGGVSFSLHCVPNDKTIKAPPNPLQNTKPTSRVVTTGEALP